METIDIQTIASTVISQIILTCQTPCQRSANLFWRKHICANRDDSKQCKKVSKFKCSAVMSTGIELWSWITNDICVTSQGFFFSHQSIMLSTSSVLLLLSYFWKKVDFINFLIYGIILYGAFSHSCYIHEVTICTLEPGYLSSNINYTLCQFVMFEMSLHCTSIQFLPS